MTMLRALLSKDLRRAWRNPVPWMLNLALPLCITALIGVIFGGKSESGLGRIRFAVVDEDQSTLTSLLRGAVSQGEGGKYLEPVFLERAEALRQLNNNSLSAALIIPTNFTRHYLEGGAVKLELVKNPGQSIHPTVIEELTGAVVTALNAISRNLQSEFPTWRASFEGDFDYHKIAALIESTGSRFEAAKRYLDPPLVTYDRNSSDANETARSQGPLKLAAPSTSAAVSTSGTELARPSAPPKPKALAKATRNPAAGVFAFLLPGMSAMFLLFVAGNAVTDLLRELRFRTFERYQTMRHHLLPFVLGKLLFAVVMVLFCSAVMLGGGGMAFQIHWEQPLPLIALTFAYACFATALMTLFVALMPDEHRAGVLTNIAGMILGMAGGCMIPRQQLPRFLGEHVTPLLPSAWFVESVRDLQFGGGASTAWVLLKFAAVTVVLVAVAVVVFSRRFRSGARV